MRDAIELIDRTLATSMRGLAMLCLVALLVILAGNVIARDFQLYATAWLDEVVELLFAWMVFIGAAALWREGEHFRIDALERALPAPASQLLRMVIALISLFFLLVMTWQGWQLTMKSTALTPILQLPVRLSYSCIPIAGFIMSAYTVVQLSRIIRGERDVGTNGQ